MLLYAGPRYDGGVVSGASLMKWLLPVLVVAATTPAVLAWPRPAAEARVVRECEEALRTGSDEEQLKALDRLKALGARGKAAIPVLIQYLPDAQPRNQARAAEMLAVYGPAARDALPVLTDLLRQRPWPFLIDACSTTFPALGDPGNAELIRVTLAASSDGRRRVNSLQPLLDQYPDAVAPVLIEHLTDSTQRVRVRAVQLLARAAVLPGREAGPARSGDGRDADPDRRRFADPSSPVRIASVTSGPSPAFSTSTRPRSPG